MNVLLSYLKNTCDNNLFFNFLKALTKLVFWNKLFGSKNSDEKKLTIFLLRADLSFKTAAQVSFRNEYGDSKILRFFDDNWSKEILSFEENIASLNFKIFIHSPNLTKSESVNLSVSLNGEIIKTKDFTINKGNDYAGWFELG